MKPILCRRENKDWIPNMFIKMMEIFVSALEILGNNASLTTLTQDIS
jgi:hypothetical protein